MSRRRRYPNNKTAKKLIKLSQKKFVKKICWSCQICPATVDPKFCYSMYDENRKVFIGNVWPSLIRVNRYFNSHGQDPRNLAANKFEAMFCSLCEYGNKPGCDFLPGCMLEWKDQMTSDAPIVYRKSKKADKFYVEATPTFFSRDNAKWSAIIKGLRDGNSDKKQNTST